MVRVVRAIGERYRAGCTVIGIFGEYVDKL
jgi:hypothetical protein